jgi:hypothetical protein
MAVLDSPHVLEVHALTELRLGFCRGIRQAYEVSGKQCQWQKQNGTQRQGAPEWKLSDNSSNTMVLKRTSLRWFRRKPSEIVVIHQNSANKKHDA